MAAELRAAGFEVTEGVGGTGRLEEEKGEETDGGSGEKSVDIPFLKTSFRAASISSRRSCGGWFSASR